MRGRYRRGRVDFGKIVMAIVAVGAAYAVWAFLPPYWAERQMDEVVTVTLLDWRDHNRGRAEDGLPLTMDKREIPEYILAEDCEFWEQGGEKHLECYWAVDVKYPLVDKRTTLEFYCHQYLDKNDLLRNWESE